MTRIEDVTDVARRHLCTGCGVCAFVAPDEVVMVDDVTAGRRPVRIAEGPQAARALDACPGLHLEHDPADFSVDVRDELLSLWGPVVALWEGHAADPDVRRRASSGGAATALAVERLRSGAAHGVLHVRAAPHEPWRNEPVLSRDVASVLAACGSRYAPASPGEGLALVEAAEGPCVVIGKPCDVAGVRQAARLRPDLAARIDLTIGVFCAGTPSTAGTLEMLATMGVTDLDDVVSVDYRGEGWPGEARVELRSRSEPPPALSYEESWGEILQRHRPWRCKICPDHTGEFADISVGDPWWRPTGDDPGRSLVVARTDRGRLAVEAAIASGALTLEPAPFDRLPRSQPNLVRTRGAVWGRVQAMRAMGMPVPRYRAVPTFGAWLRQLGPKDKVRSLAGTARRIRRDGLTRPRAVQPLRSKPTIPTRP
jgi:coenzyme F420 hydrogenase subunit beta